MEVDDATHILSNIDEDLATSIINLLDKDVQEDITILKTYNEDSAGSRMTTNYIDIASGSDIKTLMKKVVNNAPLVESINTFFVTNNNGILLGTIDLKKAIMTKSPKIIDDIMNANYNYVNVNDGIDLVIKTVADYDIYDLPVLDNGVLKGIITMDDAYLAISEEAETDYAKLAGLSDFEEIDESIAFSVKKRLPILAILLIIDIFVAMVISTFDFLFTIESLAIITVFQPVILGLSGNSGTQTLGVTLFKISNSELNHQKEINSHILKEISIGILMGIVMGLLVFVFSLALLYFIDNSLFVKISMVVAISVTLSLISANIFGSLVPIILYKIKLDPAVISGPFITTIIDLLAVLLYFVLTTLLIYNYL
jgi:magnesium transporter